MHLLFVFGLKLLLIFDSGLEFGRLGGLQGLLARFQLFPAGFVFRSEFIFLSRYPAERIDML
jgi:hypothetical protein